MGVGVLVRPPVRPVSLIAIRACAERTAALRGHSQLTRARCSGRTFRITIRRHRPLHYWRGRRRCLRCVRIGGPAMDEQATGCGGLLELNEIGITHVS